MLRISCFPFSMKQFIAAANLVRRSNSRVTLNYLQALRVVRSASLASVGSHTHGRTSPSLTTTLPPLGNSASTRRGRRGCGRCGANRRRRAGSDLGHERRGRCRARRGRRYRRRRWCSRGATRAASNGGRDRTGLDIHATEVPILSSVVSAGHRQTEDTEMPVSAILGCTH